MGLQFIRLLFSASLVKNSPLLTLDNLRTCGLTLFLPETQRIKMSPESHAILITTSTSVITNAIPGGPPPENWEWKNHLTFTPPWRRAHTNAHKAP